MDILAIMDFAAALEDRVALLYHKYSSRFRANQGGYMFWEQMSHEEKRHADMVRTYRRQRQLLPSCQGDHSVLLREFEEAHRMAVEQLELVEQEHIHEALEVARRLEEQLGKAHLARIVQMSDPMLARLMNRLGQEDHLHMERILRMARGF